MQKKSVACFISSWKRAIDLAKTPEVDFRQIRQHKASTCSGGARLAAMPVRATCDTRGCSIATVAARSIRPAQRPVGKRALRKQVRIKRYAAPEIHSCIAADLESPARREASNRSTTVVACSSSPVCSASNSDSATASTLSTVPYAAERRFRSSSCPGLARRGDQQLKVARDDVIGPGRPVEPRVTRLRPTGALMA